METFKEGGMLSSVDVLVPQIMEQVVGLPVPHLVGEIEELFAPCASTFRMFCFLKL